MDKAIAAKFNSTFQAAVVKYDASLAAKPKKDLHPEVHAALTGVANFAGLPDLGAGIVTACAAWPRVHTLLNVGLRILAWMPQYKADVAIAKAYLEAFSADVVPEICEPQKP